MKYLKIGLMALLTVLSVSVFAQDSTSQKSKTTKQAEKGRYTCTMHPGVVTGKPGKCPKCGMTLTKMAADQKVYTCPMHPKVLSSQPGKCPKCKMDLVEKKEAGI